MSNTESVDLELASFRADRDAVYAFVDCFFESLHGACVEHVVLSPGSRSTPLSIAADRARGLRTWIQLDERAAAFFALGLAKSTRRPVALVCTSGTAVANYLPAVVEAHYSRVPLILLTADRPPELRDWGAGQTIDQQGIFGRYSRWSVEVPIPTSGVDVLRYVGQLAARASEMAAGDPAGAVHLNWPLREPLAPPATTLGEAPGGRGPSAANAKLSFSRALRSADSADARELERLVRSHERGVICCGPMDADDGLCDAIAAFAQSSGWPVFADPASQMRSAGRGLRAPILDLGDALARTPGFLKKFRPEVVLRFGDAPVSKAQRLWIESVAPEEHWWMDEGGQWGEPSQLATRVVRGGAESLLMTTTTQLRDHCGRDRRWCLDLVNLNAAANAALASAISDGGDWSGIPIAKTVAKSMDAGSLLFASNSMSIRLLDLALSNRSEPLRVLCNRGANGIDGVTSTALGAAAGVGCPSLLLTGDLAFLHDLTGLLLSRHEEIPLTIVVLDDNGGGIFSLLPIAAQAEAVSFDRLFRTPHNLELARVAAAFELNTIGVESLKELELALEQGRMTQTVTIIHARVDAVANESEFRELMSRVCGAIETALGESAQAQVSQ